MVSFWGNVIVSTCPEIHALHTYSGMPPECLSTFKDQSNNVLPFIKHFFSCPIILYAFFGKNSENFERKINTKLRKVI